jgi:hypothetical protein
MRIPTMCVVLVLAAVSASGVHAADSETGEVANPKDKIVCKTQRFVGSNIPSRVCKTKGEWEQARIDAKRSLNKPPSRRMRDAEPPGAQSGSAPPNFSGPGGFSGS